MFYSAKTTKWKGVSSEHFFALSAYSFKTAITDQKDAYTIVCVSDGVTSSQSAVAAADKTRDFGDLKAVRGHGKEYALWELSCG